MAGSAYFWTGPHLIRALFGGQESVAGPFVFYLGIAVDIVTDGLVIGASFRVSADLAVLIAASLFLVDTPDGFVTMATSLMRE